MVEQTFPEDLGVTCDEYKGNRKEFHSVAEIPRECILETFLLKQTDLALEFFLSSVYSIAHHNELVQDHKQVSSKTVSRRDKSYKWNKLMETVVLGDFVFRTVIKQIIFQRLYFS